MLLKTEYYRKHKIEIRKLGTGRNIYTKKSFNPNRATYDYNIDECGWVLTGANNKEEVMDLAKAEINLLGE